MWRTKRNLNVISSLILSSGRRSILAVIVQLPAADISSNLHLRASVNTDTSLFHKDVTCGLQDSEEKGFAAVAGLSGYLVRSVATDFNWNRPD